MTFNQSVRYGRYIDDVLIMPKGEYESKLRRVRRQKKWPKDLKYRRRIRRDKLGGGGGGGGGGRSGGGGKEECKTFFESSCTTR